ncbi:MAG: SAM-dependent chlorinase/fluorinase [Candidatus Aminicenantes bacterium]|nr:SAM-dependent chlorinase/fluorinase [Candidatus Aminicenantes bacterium]
MKQTGKTNKSYCGLITDFGNQDFFSGVLKGVIKQINPHMEVIDITNEIPSYSTIAASFVVEKTYPFFPTGTIFLVVVDPGVGTGRGILLARHEERYFIGPDNGVLTPILQKENTTVSILDKEKYFLIRGNSTFEARDKMAPAAAYLGAGIALEEIASPYCDFIVDAAYLPTKTQNSISARVAYIDKFGNIMTNVSEDFLYTALEEAGAGGFKVEVNGREIEGFFKTYALAGSGPFMLIGSHRNLEIAVNRGSAASLLQARIGAEVGIIFY